MNVVKNYVHCRNVGYPHVPTKLHHHKCIGYAMRLANSNGKQLLYKPAKDDMAG
jgi:hypothetical protein